MGSSNEIGDRGVEAHYSGIVISYCLSVSSQTPHETRCSETTMTCPVNWIGCFQEKYYPVPNNELSNDHKDKQNVSGCAWMELCEVWLAILTQWHVLVEKKNIRTSLFLWKPTKRAEHKRLLLLTSFRVEECNDHGQQRCHGDRAHELSITVVRLQSQSSLKQESMVKSWKATANSQDLMRPRIGQWYRIDDLAFTHRLGHGSAAMHRRQNLLFQDEQDLESSAQGTDC